MEEKKENIDNKFKEFQYIIRDCKECNGTGYLFDTSKENGLVKSNKSKQCICIKKVYCYGLYKDANIPSEYYKLDFKKDFLSRTEESEKIKEDINKVINNIKLFKENGLGLYLYGSQGNGKTMVGIEILKKALRNGMSGHYEFFPLIIDAFMKKGYTADPKKDYYNNIFEKSDFLVIDEIAKETNDNFNKKEVCRILEINILKKRSNKNTILISNLENGADGLKNQYSSFVSSVISQRFKQIQFTGVDYRNVNPGLESFFKSENSEVKQ